MATRKIAHTNSTAIYFIAFIVIIVAFLLLGGGEWLKEMTHTHMHGGRSLGMANWNWPTILICLGLGFLLGWVASRRR
jgi:hypothetical protein